MEALPALLALVLVAPGLLAAAPAEPQRLAFYLHAEGDAARVVAWLQERGVDARQATARVVLADAPRAAWERHLQDAAAPSALARDVMAIVGRADAPLDTYAEQGGTTGLGPAELRAAYGMDEVHARGLRGTGMAVAITSWGPPSQADLDAYSDAFGLPRATLQVRTPLLEPCDGPRLAEWDLDVQLAHAFAPDAALHAYCAPAPRLADMLAVLDMAVQDDIVDVISQSWGTCEALVDDATARAFADVVARAARQGQAVFTASGDGGSRECTRRSIQDQRIAASFPGTLPSGVSVGGTSLAPEGERAWNRCAPCPDEAWAASGGAPSLHFAAPWWQPPGARLASDVSAVADRATGPLVRSDGGWIRVGGTSVAAPLWAGAWTSLAQAAGRQGNPAPLVWGSGGMGLRDITVGDNGDFAAGPGHDLPTGWGAPDGAALLARLEAMPPAANGLMAHGSGPGQLTLSWSGAGPWLVLLSADGEDERVVSRTNDSLVRLSGLASGTRYHARVVAEPGEGALGGFSPAVAVTTWAAPSEPRLALAAAGRVSWWAPADDGGAPVTGYVVLRDGAPIVRLPADARAYEDADCPPPAACRYAVAATNAVGDGPAAAAPGL